MTRPAGLKGSLAPHLRRLAEAARRVLPSVVASGSPMLAEKVSWHDGRLVQHGQSLQNTAELAVGLLAAGEPLEGAPKAGALLDGIWGARLDEVPYQTVAFLVWAEALAGRGRADAAWELLGRRLPSNESHSMDLAWVLDATGWKVGGFDPSTYRRTTARNADFRKYDDGLRLTIDCDDATRLRIEALLRDGAERGVVDWGLHVQSAALMTCIVPSFLRDDHVHFVDGAGGGYTLAAAAIKARGARTIAP